MYAWIYKGTRKPHAYLYVSAKDNFECVPKSLLNLLGTLSFVLGIELGADRRLTQADIEEVRRQLDSEGYYLQLPPGDQKPEKIC